MKQAKFRGVGLQQSLLSLTFLRVDCIQLVNVVPVFTLLQSNGGWSRGTSKASLPTCLMVVTDFLVGIDLYSLSAVKSGFLITEKERRGKYWYQTEVPQNVYLHLPDYHL